LPAGSLLSAARWSSAVRYALARPGALIVALQQDGPAAKAGIAVGDLIEKVDNQEIADASALAETLAKHQPGDRVTVLVFGLAGSSRTTAVTLGQLPGT
jgi:S1-C subfamily serine protease